MSKFITVVEKLSYGTGFLLAWTVGYFCFDHGYRSAEWNTLRNLQEQLDKKEKLLKEKKSENK